MVFFVMKIKNETAFYKDQQSEKATKTGMDEVLQTRVLRRLKREARYKPIATQDVEQASSNEESSSSQLSSLSIDTDVFLHTEEISTSRHKEKENFV